MLQDNDIDTLAAGKRQVDGAAGDENCSDKKPCDTVSTPTGSTKCAAGICTGPETTTGSSGQNTSDCKKEGLCDIPEDDDVGFTDLDNHLMCGDATPIQTTRAKEVKPYSILKKSVKAAPGDKAQHDGSADEGPCCEVSGSADMSW